MHHNKNIKYLAVFSFVLISCNTSRKLYDKYCMQAETVNNTVLFFDANNRLFKGYSYSDVAGQFLVTGRWAIDRDTLYLLPDRPSLIDSITIVANNADDHTVIRVIDAERKQAIEGVLISVGDKNYTTSEKGEVVLSAINAENLLLNYKNIQGIILVTDIAKRTVNVNIDFRKLNSFNVSKKWLLKNKKIIPLEEGFSIFKKCP